MDIEKLLQEKLKDSEKIKKNRLSKQNELMFSTQITPNNANHVSEEPLENNSIHNRNQHNEPAEITDHTNSVDIDNLKLQIQRDVERQIRLELEESYKKQFDDAIIMLHKQTAFQTDNEKELEEQEAQESNNIEELTYPKTNVKKIVSMDSDNSKILSLHDDYICLWDFNSDNNELSLCNSYQIFSKVTAVIFDSMDSDQIIYGCESGFIFIYNFKTKNILRSQIQISSITAIAQSANALVILTSNGQYLGLATNLIDILHPLTNIFTDFELSSSVNHENTTITACYVINANSIIIGLITSEVLLVDFGSRKMNVLLNQTPSSLPVISLDYNAGKLLVLSLDHSIKIINVTTGMNIVENIDTMILTFYAKWLSSSYILTCSITNVITIWKLDNTKFLKIGNFETKKKEEPPFISAIHVLNKSLILVGDLTGKMEPFNVDVKLVE